MEFKAKIFNKVIFGITSLFLIVLPFCGFIDGYIFTKFTDKIWFIILYLISTPIFIFLGIDLIFQLFRTINIDENNIKLKIFGKTIKEENIETIEYNEKHYGIRKITHAYGIKSIIVNKKYFSFISMCDNNYYRIKI